MNFYTRIISTLTLLFALAQCSGITGMRYAPTTGKRPILVGKCSSSSSTISITDTNTPDATADRPLYPLRMRK